MNTVSFERTALSKCIIAGCAVVFGACLAIERAQAQTNFVNPPIPPQQPVFNPSSPYTVPQAPYKPLSLGTPSVGSSAGPYLYENPPTEPPHRRVAHSATTGANIVQERAGKHDYRHHSRTRSNRGGALVSTSSSKGGSSYFPAGNGYVPSPYSCTWRREADGYWVHSCF